HGAHRVWRGCARLAAAAPRACRGGAGRAYMSPYKRIRFSYTGDYMRDRTQRIWSPGGTRAPRKGAELGVVRVPACRAVYGQLLYCLNLSLKQFERVMYSLHR